MSDITSKFRKLREREIVYHIRSSKPLERCQIDLLQLARVLCIKPYTVSVKKIETKSQKNWD